MRRYETVAITLADYPDSEIEALIERYGRIISSQGGTLIRAEKWGRRKLAYEIKKQTKGFYFLFNFIASQGTVEEMERNFRLDDRILRFLTVKLSDQVDMEEIKKELEGASKTEPAPQEEVTEKPEGE